MKILSEKEYYTIFIAGFGKYGPRHFIIPALIVNNYRKFFIAGLLSLFSFFVINILFFISYKNALSDNNDYADQIEKLKIQNELLDNNKVAEKMSYIENNLKILKRYLTDRGFIKTEDNNILASDNSNDNLKIIDYYYNNIRDISDVIKNIPLGLPYNGIETSGYGNRGNPFGGRGGEFHPGIDLKGKLGDEIHATSDGTVIKASWYNGYGNAVIIQHKFGLTTLYGHMSSLNVAEGQYVRAGDVIGYLGSTGRSTGPHVHYEIRLDNDDINPEEFINLKY